MKRFIVIILLLALAGAAGWYLTGGPQRLAERRVTEVLEKRGMPPEMAECMVQGLAAKLSLAQLRKLEKLAPEEGEADVPLTVPDFLERVRRVDDPEVVTTALGVAANCALDFGI